MSFLLKHSIVGRTTSTLFGSGHTTTAEKSALPTISGLSNKSQNDEEQKLEETTPIDEQEQQQGYNSDSSNEEDLSKHSETDLNIVDWDGPSDPENPQNWPFKTKVATTAVISFMTFTVYIGSSIYTPSVPGIMEEFDVGYTKAILGLSLYVLAYGIGPLVLSPISEIPFIGRNIVYIVTFLLFMVFQLVGCLAKNYNTIMAMRFLCGFFGSPALATGVASLQDMFPPLQMPLAVLSYGLCTVIGPVLGPTVGGFAALKLGWRWPLWILLILSGFTYLIMLFFLPETYAPTLLLRKAARLRHESGNNNLKSKSETDRPPIKDVLFEALIRPFQLGLEPIVFFCNLYLGLGYGIFYLWFEAFPIVFGDIYHFNLGEQGLPFLGLAVGFMGAGTGYYFYQKYHAIPKILRTGTIIPEDQLKVSLSVSVFIPVSLFIFGWTARKSCHWIGPIIGAALYVPGLFLLFQTLLVYLPLSYPTYAASVLAINTAVRSSMASSFPLFGRGMYDQLGVGPGCSLLAGLSIAMIPFLFLLCRYGASIRRWSKYAQ